MHVLSSTAGILVAVVFSLSLNVARASTIAYDNDTSTSNQFVGVGFNIGLKFAVNQSIEVTSLGAFDSGNVANLAGTQATGVTLGIFDNNTQALVAGSSTVTLMPTSTVTTINGDSFFTLATPIVLAPGSYMIVAFDDLFYNDRVNTGGIIPSPPANPHSTQNTGGGLISFLAPNQYLAASSFAYATNSDANEGSNPNQFMAGTFQFDAVSVPEPASLALAVCGLFGLMAVARFGRDKARG